MSNDRPVRAGGPAAAEVAARLRVLRDIAVIETDAEARARLRRERPATEQPFAVAVGARLTELRALCDLAEHLRQGRAPR
ncbi:MAG TPA: hypothetical protein VIU64_01145 [Polyangia bacterium]